ncbi:MAG: polymer-forming cytoskeletal protein [Phycisphaeraceae bacterium]|nr:polymer-forming cytoskeletal protein [Phycisphaeraceae bacterium]
MASQRDNGGNETTIIGTGARFKGELVLDGPMQIQGAIEGTVTSQSQVQIGRGAQCRATIDAATIVVDGAVEGDLLARERLQLNSTSNVTGDIAAAALIVAEGATFVGRVSVGPEAVIGAQQKQRAYSPAAEPKATPATGNDWSRTGNEQTTSTDWLAANATTEAA